MTESISIELLESLHRFPGPFTFKAIGRTEGDFVGRLLAAVRAELGLSLDPPYSTRSAAGGRHVAVTMEVAVASAHQVTAVYGRMRTVDGLVMLL